MKNQNRTSTGELKRRIMTSQRTRQRAMFNCIVSENAAGKFLSNHDIRCLELMGVDIQKMFKNKNIEEKIKTTLNASKVAKQVEEELDSNLNDN